MNKVSTIAIVDEQPAEVYRLLVAEGKSLKFKPKEEPTDEIAKQFHGGRQTDLDAEADSGAAQGRKATEDGGRRTGLEDEVVVDDEADHHPRPAARPRAQEQAGPHPRPFPRAQEQGTGEGSPETGGQTMPTADSQAAASIEVHPDEVIDPTAAAGSPGTSPVVGRASASPDPSSVVGRPSSILDDDLELPSLDFVPYDRAGLEERYADTVLQTASTAEQLDKSLRRIDEQARSTLEEQGVNALFLALGMLHYKEAPESAEVFRAPLVLVPVELVRKSARAGYQLKATDDEPLVNPALAEYLRRMHRIMLPELPEATEDGGRRTDPSSLVAASPAGSSNVAPAQEVETETGPHPRPAARPRAQEQAGPHPRPFPRAQEQGTGEGSPVTGLNKPAEGVSTGAGSQTGPSPVARPPSPSNSTPLTGPSSVVGRPSSSDPSDLQRFFTAVSDSIANQRDWHVTSEVYLGLFSFQKFVMYKDLEANTPSFNQHRLIQQLVTRAGQQFLSMPDDVRALELDRDFAPEQTFQVVDADASQIRAIAAVARAYDLVIEGPPGTGKSQTITNLIAQALSAGKSVLFVAEKMAALQVVYRRLVAAGLGEFCLELHSTKANKRAVMRQVATALDASLQRPVVATQSTQRLPLVRHSLTEYTNAVHTPFGALELSPYRAYGELGAVIDAPRLKFTGAAEAVTRDQLEQAVRDLDDLAVAAAGIGNPAVHPWRGAERTLYTEDDLEAIRGLAQDLIQKLAVVTARAAEAQAALGLKPMTTFGGVDEAAQVAAVMARSPGAPLAVLQSEAWNSAPAAAVALVERGRALAGLKQQLLQQFAPAVFESEHAGDIAYVEQKSSGLLGVLAFLDGRYRAIQRRWQAYRLPAYRASLLEQAHELKRVDEYRRGLQQLTAAEAQATQAFGALWHGERSNWDALDAYIKWVVELRALVVRQGLAGRTLELAAQRAPNVTAAFAVREAATAALKTLGSLRQAVGWAGDSLQAETFEAIIGRARGLIENIGLGPRWAAFEANRARVAHGLAAESLPPAMAGEVPFAALRPGFLRAFYQKWLGQVVQQREPLAVFHALNHEQRVAEFRALDERVLLENRAALVARLRDQVQQRLRDGPAAAGMPYLRREMARQRNLSPLRATLKHAEAAIRAIKPCFMMSPLSVAQLLDGKTPSFDVVIFDEASQLPPEDAVGAIIRGAQLIVVGDPKQLPPTNFFAVMGGQVTAPVGEDGLPQFEDGESVLEEYMGAGLPTSRLKWHYRSTHESLIAFSNVSFYDAELHTFPSVTTGDTGSGIQFEYVAGGVYEGKGLNLAEARRVADAVVEHARTHPELSLGVGTFNLRQQLAIQDEVEQRRREDPSLEPFFAQEEDKQFFVKNLENIQGDERDVIFISVTYAKAPDGRLRYNFGPLNLQNGWRRLNVLATRARKLMRIFSSIHGADIADAPTLPLGARLLREFLLYAETGRLESSVATAEARAGSPFEQDVYNALTQRGLLLEPQVGVSGYRIDFGVRDPGIPGRYVCGLECDGVAYHASETARDRDRLRQQVLERRGWTILRVWSTDWFKDRAGTIERLMGQIAAAAMQAAADAKAQAEADARAKAEAEARAAALLTAGGEAEAAEADEEPTALAKRDAQDRPYRRPAVKPYRFASRDAPYSGEFLAARNEQIQRAIVTVVEAEAPLPFADLAARVAAMWDSRLGARITARIREACQQAERNGLLKQRGDFVHSATRPAAARSRSGTRLTPEHIAPEEYRAAVLLILGTGHAFTRAELIGEVRALFGYGRATPALEAATTAQIDALLAEGVAGEASAGVALRTKDEG